MTAAVCFVIHSHQEWYVEKRLTSVLYASVVQWLVVLLEQLCNGQSSVRLSNWALNFICLHQSSPVILPPVIPVSSVIPALLEFGWIPGNPAKKFNNILSGINCYSENSIHKTVHRIPGNPPGLLYSGRNPAGICGGV